jgi:hypothetical protein
MDVVLNELSLDAQYATEMMFLTDLEEIVKITTLFEKLQEIVLLKNQNVWNSKITTTKTLQELLYIKGNPLLTKLRVNLLKLTSNPPYWEEDRRHQCEDNLYLYRGKDVCDSGLAESVERDRNILSFTHNDFQDAKLTIQKNTSDICITNFLDFKSTLLSLWETGAIDEEHFCKYYFHDTNLNFVLLNEARGFSQFGSVEKKQFIEQFKLFSKMRWDEIISSDGLEYKRYENSLSGYESENIYKFRVSQKFRCYGYRKEDVFFVVHLEVDHTLSDRG